MLSYISTDPQQCCVYSAADTMQQPARLQKTVRKSKMFPKKKQIHMQNTSSDPTVES